jgi:hypothetical protein
MVYGVLRDTCVKEPPQIEMATSTSAAQISCELAGMLPARKGIAPLVPATQG